ncbi:gfo/Idh/MocA family oxidoreductase [Nocardioides mangrovicus]|uniref:Gfo/Idh/MocA family oxidoreductase n=2 Tax=Nocardioides mangrovicus TaxID=2478913 RepID=A0A3L8P4L5_9ACTN|nr:gfo/Idh/MocA family oxidoreductase [Nocardioides mangrovicus]
MGQVHARAWSRLRQHYPDAPFRPELVAVADPSAQARDLALATYADVATYEDWRELLARDDLDVVSMAGPNALHHEVGVAVAESGRHLWIEKPAGRRLAETQAIADAVETAGVQSAAGFNYRNAPAVEWARELVRGGRLGQVQTVEVRFLADYAAHPDGGLSWRFIDEHAGSGVLGDLVSHAADLACHLAGEVAELVADEGRFITERPLVAGAGSHFARGGDGERGRVENEDYVGALLRFASGARGTLAASRTAVGEQCTYGFSVHGSAGALEWDFRRMGELRVCLDQDPQDAAYRTVYVDRNHGETAAFQPAGGIALGYDDLKVIEAHRLARSIAADQPEGATIHDAVRAARLAQAMATSVSTRGWTPC